MPLQLGAWTIVLNGQVGQMTFGKVNPDGSLSGSMKIASLNIDVFLEGYWNEQSSQVTFGTFVNGNVPPVIMVFFGCLFADNNRLPGIQGGKVYTLAGSAKQFYPLPPFVPGPGASADQNEFGWYAQVGVA